MMEIAIAAVVGIVVGVLVRHFYGVYQHGAAENNAKRLLEEAKIDAKRIRAEADIQNKQDKPTASTSCQHKFPG